MKFIALFVLLCTFVAFAMGNFTHICIATSDGEKVYYPIQENPQLDFTDTVLFVTTDKLNAKFKCKSLSEIIYKRIDPNSINGVTSDYSSLNVNDEYIVFSNLHEGTQVSIFALNGSLIFYRINYKESEIYFPINKLKSREYYIVKINNVIHKIYVK